MVVYIKPFSYIYIFKERERERRERDCCSLKKQTELVHIGQGGCIYIPFMGFSILGQIFGGSPFGNFYKMNIKSPFCLF